MNVIHRDDEGDKLGMWLFLLTEIILFGGMFVLFAVTMAKFPDDFHKASKELDVLIGSINTVVLITSSLFVALAVVAIKKADAARAKLLLLLTKLFALIFLVNKYFEWSAKFHHGIYPGAPMDGYTQGEQAFFNLYFVMTGLHGIHVLVGMGLLFWVWLLVKRGKVNDDRYVALENSGLYWHLVDLIWIYLFPLFYLVT